MYLKEIKTLSWRDSCSSVFITTLFTIAKTRKQPMCPSVDEWIKKMWYICTGEYYSTIKGGSSPICDNMDGSWGYYAKWNKSDRERQILYDLTYMWKLKNSTYKNKLDWWLPGTRGTWWRNAWRWSWGTNF